MSLAVGLDPLLREGIWTVLRELADAGKTVLVSSHVMRRQAVALVWCKGCA
ncbi:hypothetical protein ACQUSY_03435 [Microbacterium sp. YY-03]|uniref:hypothetical protein n=1 Tax=Microbacterium sp. YY-03 TaxID=3421636 RepID=UPI003D16D12E